AERQLLGEACGVGLEIAAHQEPRGAGVRARELVDCELRVRAGAVVEGEGDQALAAGTAVDRPARGHERLEVGGRAGAVPCPAAGLGAAPASALYGGTAPAPPAGRAA